nr:hypothetical protein Iba_chr01dCG1800 [Ipomoea batatas]
MPEIFSPAFWVLFLLSLVYARTSFLSTVLGLIFSVRLICSHGYSRSGNALFFLSLDAEEDGGLDAPVQDVASVGAKWLLADLPETPVCVPSTPTIPTGNLEHAENASTLQGLITKEGVKDVMLNNTYKASTGSLP